MVIIRLCYHNFHLLNAITHFDLALPYGNIRAIRNATHTSRRVLCLHGWLDNCASFMPMMPFLDELEVVAVDLPGHGRSDHRDRGSLCHYIDYVRDIKLILDALKWDRCHLLGHSMGGSLSMMSCSAFPERVQSLIMIDALHPQSRLPEEGPPMLRRSMAQFTSWDPSRKRVFPDLDAAISARRKASQYPQSESSARTIMEYAMESQAEGCSLRSDPRLNFRSPLMLSRDQVNAFIQEVQQPVLAILASAGISSRRNDVESTLALFRDIEVMRIDGGHHVHIDQAEQVAQHICAFLGGRGNGAQIGGPGK